MRIASYVFALSITSLFKPISTRLKIERPSESSHGQAEALISTTHPSWALKISIGITFYMKDLKMSSCRLDSLPVSISQQLMTIWYWNSMLQIKNLHRFHWDWMPMLLIHKLTQLHFHKYMTNANLVIHFLIRI